MKLLVTKYRSGSGVSLEEVNYFSQLPKTTVGTIDLADYLIKNGISEISYAANKIDSTNGFYLEAGEVNMKCSNMIEGWGSLGEYIPSSDTLLEFFDFYNESNLYFWFIQIWNDERTAPIWSGIIKRENISASKRSDEIISITAVSLDKEFSEYFSNQFLVGFNNFSYVSPIFSGSNGFPIFNLNSARLVNAIETNFPGISFNFQGDPTHFIHLYYIIDKSYIYAPLLVNLINGNDTLVIKAGYDPFVLQEVDRFTWLHDICKGMGWKMIFKNTTISIEQRASITATPVTLDFETDFMTHGVQSLELTNIQTVLIEDGEYYGGNNSEVEDPTATNLIDEDEVYHYIGGHDNKVYSDSFGSNYNYNTPFRRLVTEFGTVYVRRFDDWSMIKEAENSGANKTVMNLYFGLNYGSVYQYQKLTATDNNTIKLDLVTNTAYPTSVDLDNARNNDGNFYGNGNSYSQAHDAGNNGIYMYGNPCHALVRFDTNANRFETYDIYTNSEQFRSNFTTVTGTGNKLHLNVLLNGIYENADAVYKIVNYPYKNIVDYRFSVIETSLDLINQTTTLKLVGQ